MKKWYEKNKAEQLPQLVDEYMGGILNSTDGPSTAKAMEQVWAESKELRFQTKSLSELNTDVHFCANKIGYIPKELEWSLSQGEIQQVAKRLMSELGINKNKKTDETAILKVVANQPVETQELMSLKVALWLRGGTIKGKIDDALLQFSKNEKECKEALRQLENSVLKENVAWRWGSHYTSLIATLEQKALLENQSFEVNKKRNVL